MGRLPDQRIKLALLYNRLEIDERMPSGEGVPIEFRKRDPAGNWIGEASNLHKKLNRKNFKNWVDQGIEPKNITHVLSNYVAELYNIVNDRTGSIETADMISGSMGITTFGRMLKFRKSEIRFIVDNLYGKLLPTVSMFSIRQEKASKFMLRHGGFYILYRLDYSKGGQPFITQCPLSIRYLLKSNKTAASRHNRIRCKTIIPSFGETIQKYEYDGSVSSSTSAWFWIFEMRENVSEGDPDVFFMTTSLPEKRDSSEFLRGDAISQSVHVHETNHWSVLIRRIERYICEKDINSHDFFEIIDTENSEIEDTESMFFEEHCKMTPLKDFKDTLVLQNLLQGALLHPPTAIDSNI